MYGNFEKSFLVDECEKKAFREIFQHFLHAKFFHVYIINK